MTWRERCLLPHIAASQQRGRAFERILFFDSPSSPAVHSFCRDSTRPAPSSICNGRRWSGASQYPLGFSAFAMRWCRVRDLCRAGGGPLLTYTMDFVTRYISQGSTHTRARGLVSRSLTAALAAVADGEEATVSAQARGRCSTMEDGQRSRGSRGSRAVRYSEIQQGCRRQTVGSWVYRVHRQYHTMEIMDVIALRLEYV